MTLELPFATESLNTLMGWKHHPRTRGWKYADHRRQMVDEVFFAVIAVAGSLGRKATARMRVRFTRYCSGTLDDMNLRGGCKPLVDAMVQLGLLHDDSPQWLDDHYEQVRTKRGDKRMRIEIEAVS
jgi:hypothetical protein